MLPSHECFFVLKKIPKFCFKNCWLDDMVLLKHILTKKRSCKQIKSFKPGSDWIFIHSKNHPSIRIALEHSIEACKTKQKWYIQKILIEDHWWWCCVLKCTGIMISHLTHLTLMLLVANLIGPYKMMQKIWKMTETQAHGYSSESTQWEPFNECQHDRV